MSENAYTVVAYKVKFAAIVVFAAGGVLGAGSIVCFAASALNEFAPDFLFTCIGLLGTAGALIMLGVRMRQMPKELILADENGLYLVPTGVTIPYAAVCGLRSKYSEREIFIMTSDGTTHAVGYVAGYKKAKQRIAELIRERAGHEVFVS